MKYKQLENIGKSLLDFSNFPKTIKHKKIDLGKSIDNNQIFWKNETKNWFLNLETCWDEKEHKINYRISYVLYGFEGAEQLLPEGEDSLFDEGGIIDSTPWDCIKKMKIWLEKEGLLKVEN